MYSENILYHEVLFYRSDECFWHPFMELSLFRSPSLMDISVTGVDGTYTTCRLLEWHASIPFVQPTEHIQQSVLQVARGWRQRHRNARLSFGHCPVVETTAKGTVPFETLWDCIKMFAHLSHANAVVSQLSSQALSHISNVDNLVLEALCGLLPALPAHDLLDGASKIEQRLLYNVWVNMQKILNSLLI